MVNDDYPKNRRRYHPVFAIYVVRLRRHFCIPNWVRVGMAEIQKLRAVFKAPVSWR